MNSLPFDKPGRFYKGNLHTHSTRSDGTLRPEQVIATYRDAGYDFISLTDHFLRRYDYPIVDTRIWNSATFATIPGAELHRMQIESGDPWHILAVGLPLDFAPPPDDETGSQMAARAAEAGAFVGIAHPAWYALTLDDALTLEAAHAVEVYNATADADSDRGTSWHIAEMLLGRRCRLLAYAADDAHFMPNRPDNFKGWVQVRAERLEPDTLLAALKAGHFYSSQGPDFRNIAVAGEQLRIDCSPVVSIHVTGTGSRIRWERGEQLTGATIPLERFVGSYCRVTIVDANGKRAWSNPIWLD